MPSSFFWTHLFPFSLFQDLKQFFRVEFFFGGLHHALFSLPASTGSECLVCSQIFPRGSIQRVLVERVGRGREELNLASGDGILKLSGAATPPNTNKRDYLHLLLFTLLYRASQLYESPHLARYVSRGKWTRLLTGPKGSDKIDPQERSGRKPWEKDRPGWQLGASSSCK